MKENFKNIITEKIKKKFNRPEKDSVKYKTTFTTRMKKNDTSKSSQSNEPKDNLNIQ